MNKGFITITFVLIMSSFLTFVSLHAYNDEVLFRTLIHIEEFYTTQLQQESCGNLEMLQSHIHDATFSSPCF
jgi:hypothetical protein